MYDNSLHFAKIAEAKSNILQDNKLEKENYILATIHREAPTSIESLRIRLREAVLTYEPRLKRVRVETEGVDVYEMRTTFIIRGEVGRGRRIQLETTFGSQEAALVRPASS